MSATTQQIRNAIAAKITGVAGAGVVHSYERYLQRMADLKLLFQPAAGGPVKGWIVRRLTTQETSPGTGRYVVDHGWQIRGYMSLSDDNATELAFDTLVEQIRDAFRADDDLGGLIQTMSFLNEGGLAGLQVTDSGPVMFCDVLCHGVRCTVTTRHNLLGGA